MKTLSLAIISALLLLSACGKMGPKATPKAASPAQGYTEVGNGGDFIRILFEQGRQYAEGVVRRIDEKSVPSYLRQGLEPGEIDWMLQNKNLLADHIHGGRHVWVEKLPEACSDVGCGCNLGGTEILLAQLKCESTVNLRPESAQLLVHESLHSFFGNNESKVRRLGAAFFMIWANMGHPEYPHWKEITPPPPFLRPNSVSVWTGSELMVWDGLNFAFYNPHNSVWRTETPRNSFFEFSTDPNWSTIMGSQFVYPIWNSGVLNLFLCEPKPSTQFAGLRGSSGVVFDPVIHSWKKMSSKNMPAECGRPLSIGNSIFYVSSERSEHIMKDDVTVAAIYSPSSDKWTKVTLPEQLQRRQGESSLWTGSQMIVWGGMVWQPHRTPAGLNSGSAYNPTTNTWADLPTEGAPTGRMEHAAFWTGSKMVVYGGVTSLTYYDRDHLTSGASYDPTNRKWTPIKEGAIRPRPHPHLWGLRGVWVGTHELLSDRNMFVSYQPYNDEWSSIDFLFPRGIKGDRADFVWTGMDVLVWDGQANRGYAYYPN